MLTKPLDEYTKALNEQLDKVIEEAQEAYRSLEFMSSKLETIQNLIYNEKYISQSRINVLRNGTHRSWFSDGRELDIAKNQHNIETLDGIIRVTRIASQNINEIILKLKLFKAEATSLKGTTVPLHSSRRNSLERDIQIIEATLKRLTQSKQILEGKIVRSSQKSPNF